MRFLKIAVSFFFLTSCLIPPTDHRDREKICTIFFSNLLHNSKNVVPLHPNCPNNIVHNNTMTSIRQFQRYIWLVDLLYSRGALTRQQINDYWQNASLNDENEAAIPRRTFFRMKDDILILFGIQIDCVSGNKYAIANRNDIKSDDVQNWLLNSFSVSNLLMEGQSLKDRLLLEDMPSGNKYLTQVIDAMRQNLTLQVEYQSFNMSNPRTFEIAPYCIKVFKQRWYIIGLREGNDEVHFYSLDRVLSMQITENAFKVPKSFNADAFLHNYYGVMAGTMPAESVLLRVTPFRANYLRSLPLHHSQNEVERTEEYSLFEYWIAPTADFIQELRSFLPDIIVLRPLWLREKFINEAKNILDNYKKMN